MSRNRALGDGHLEGARVAVGDVEYRLAAGHAHAAAAEAEIDLHARGGVEFDTRAVGEHDGCDVRRAQLWWVSAGPKPPGSSRAMPSAMAPTPANAKPATQPVRTSVRWGRPGMQAAQFGGGEGP